MKQQIRKTLISVLRLYTESKWTIPEPGLTNINFGVFNKSIMIDSNTSRLFGFGKTLSSAWSNNWCFAEHKGKIYLGFVDDE